MGLEGINSRNDMSIKRNPRNLAFKIADSKITLAVGIAAAVMIAGLAAALHFYPGVGTMSSVELGAAASGVSLGVTGATIANKNTQGKTGLQEEADKKLINSTAKRLEEINARDEFGGTLLFRAVVEGHLEDAKLLLSFGADPEIETGVGNSPIFTALVLEDREIVINGFKTKEEKREMVEALIEYCKNPPALYYDKRGLDLSPQQEAMLEEVKPEVASYSEILSTRTVLRESDRNWINELKKVDAKDENGQTPLHRAVLRGDIEDIHALLELNAGFRSDKKGMDPLELAVFHGKLDIARIFLKAFGVQTEEQKQIDIEKIKRQLPAIKNKE